MIWLRVPKKTYTKCLLGEVNNIPTFTYDYSIPEMTYSVKVSKLTSVQILMFSMRQILHEYMLFMTNYKVIGSVILLVLVYEFGTNTESNIEE